MREEVYGRYHRGYNVPGVVDQRSPPGQIGMNDEYCAPGHFDNQDREARQDSHDGSSRTIEGTRDGR
jgi:hypothetical protein